VQRDGDRVRVNAQFIDAESGAHLWAERFEEDLADLFKLQDQVVARLANAMGYELVKAEAARGARAANPDSIDLTMRGWMILNSPPNKEDYVAAHEFFTRALALDTRNAEAMAGLAYADFRAFIYSWISAKPEDAVASALSLTAKATEINPDYAHAYYIRSLALFFGHRYTDALEASQMAIKLNPNLAFGYFGMGQAESLLGRCEQSIAHVKEAFRISPRDPGGGLWHMEIGNAETCLGHYDAAIQNYKLAVATYPTYMPYAYWAVAAALKGDDAEAKRVLAEAKRLNLSLSVKWFAAHLPAMDFVVPGLRKAGLAEE
jgi:tetratricopeptide (TPR) repeat protein